MLLVNYLTFLNHVDSSGKDFSDVNEAATAVVTYAGVFFRQRLFCSENSFSALQIAIITIQGSF